MDFLAKLKTTFAWINLSTTVPEAEAALDIQKCRTAACQSGGGQRGS